MATRHFEPVKFLLELVKRIVTDLLVGPHGEYFFTCRVQSPPMELLVFRVPVGRNAFVSEMCGEFLANRVRDW